ncbi:MATE family efflux transporter [Paenibacillus aurantiacus]|uniref:MATE family efflux transporter n=1 Tax=Paenibacillus aurantiacus TaxID=1936118 RepID=A0ABV5KMC3_9BACL
MKRLISFANERLQEKEGQRSRRQDAPPHANFEADTPTRPPGSSSGGAEDEREAAKLGLWQLSWPIGIELMLQFLMGTVDTLMVSRIGDNAVSAVGVSNQILQAAMMLFTVVNAGAGAILARMWGARQWTKARKTAAIAIQVNIAFGLAGGLFFAFGSGWALRLMGVPSEVRPYANGYLTIVGTALIVIALHLVVNALIRNTGNTKGPMLITVAMNVLHLLLNYALIFGAGAFPAMGVEGSALSTVLSRLAALAAALFVLWRTFRPRLGRADFRGADRGLVREILAIGLPVSVTAMSWGFSQLVLLAVISSFGPVPLATYTYLQTVEQFPWMIASAVGGALAIQVGHWHGAGLHARVHRGPYRAIQAGTFLILAASAALWLAGEPVMRLFTGDHAIIASSLPLLAMCIAWQALRVLPFCLSGALNVVGGARPVAVISVIGMWFVSTGGAYVFGVSLGWGLKGVLLAMMQDELARGVLFAYLWRRRRVKNRIDAEHLFAYND